MPLAFMPILLLRSWLQNFLFIKQAKHRRMQKLNFIFTYLLLALAGCTPTSSQDSSPKTKVIGTYGSPPVAKDGTILYDTLISQLKDLHCNTYNWLIMPDTNSLKQLKEFLPVAKKSNIDVWATLIPPVELEAMKVGEYTTNDMRKWAAELAALSVTY